MEKLGFEGLAILLILLPGFLCSGLIQLLCVRPAQTEFDKVREALLYSFIIYVIFICAFGPASPVSLNLSEENGVKSYGFKPDIASIVKLAIISVVLALAVGATVTNDISGKFFRLIRSTQRTSRSSVWSDTFHVLSGWVEVELGDGRRVVGWLRYYSDEPEPTSLFLEKAYWVRDAERVPIKGPGILITQKLGIRTVEFRHGKKEKPETMKESSGSKDGSTSSGVFRVVIAVVIVIVIAALVWAAAILMVKFFPFEFLGFGDKPEQKAWAGEAVNLSGLVVSALAFSALIYTVWLQRSQLQATTRDQLRMQGLLDEQAKAMRGTARANGLATRIEYFYEQVRAVERDVNTPEQAKELTKTELREAQAHLVYHLDNVLNQMGVGLADPAPGSPHNVEVGGVLMTKWAAAKQKQET
jgi:Family of unknown function (DUF6338)